MQHAFNAGGSAPVGPSTTALVLFLPSCTRLQESPGESADAVPFQAPVPQPAGAESRDADSAAVAALNLLERVRLDPAAPEDSAAHRVAEAFYLYSLIRQEAPRVAERFLSIFPQVAVEKQPETVPCFLEAGAVHIVESVRQRNYPLAASVGGVCSQVSLLYGFGQEFMENGLNHAAALKQQEKYPREVLNFLLSCFPCSDSPVSARSKVLSQKRAAILWDAPDLSAGQYAPSAMRRPSSPAREPGPRPAHAPSVCRGLL